MNSRILLAALAVSALANPALAGESSSGKEVVGVGSGAVVGAIAGGPVGAIIGAAIGAKLGDAFYRQDVEVEQLTADLGAARQREGRLRGEVGTLNASVDRLGAELDRMRGLARPELLALLQSGIEMDLLFRTDEDALSDDTATRLRQFAASLAAMPDVAIKLDGYADERGDADYNRELSERRAASVRALLVSGGVRAERIRVDAHGESPAADSNADSYALERKVSLTLFLDDSPAVASNP
ncbi:MAG: OmpA family protein [Gammaproteobacteria bacterium]|nr:OmpA family protein [Gammaproteobacteria bacterium]MDH4255082.1 OmpA family protein [Gammaproteobacteria bacterium]MDH5308762.1 OmpA family protein [Gammaproteobacteria bacterium]